MDAPFGSVHARHRIDERQVRPFEHQDLDAEVAGGRDLAVGGVAATVLRHDNIDPPFDQERALIGFRERPARQQVPRVRNIQIDRLDTADEVEMLRRGRERSDLLPAKRQKDPARRSAERSNGFSRIANRCPAVALLPLPGRAPQCQQRDPGAQRGVGGVARHPLGERMRGIDQQIDLLLQNVVGQAVSPSEAAGDDRHSMRKRIAGSAGQRQGDLEAVAFCQTRGESARVARASEDENAAHDR